MFGIIAFGDSITFGRGEQPCIGWAGRLKNDFEKEDRYNCVFNLGIPGETSAGILTRIEAESRSRAAYRREGDRFIIIIAVGINDTKADEKDGRPQLSKEDFKENILKAIRSARGFTKQVIVVGLTPVDESKTKPYEGAYLSNKTIKEYDDILKDIAISEDAFFIGLLGSLAGNNYIKTLSDGIHPSSEGYDMIYNLIWEELMDKGLD